MIYLIILGIIIYLLIGRAVTHILNKNKVYLNGWNEPNDIFVMSVGYPIILIVWIVVFAFYPQLLIEKFKEKKKR